MSQIIKNIPQAYRDVLIEHLNALLDQKYATSICITVQYAIRQVRENFTDPSAIPALRSHLPYLLSDHEFVEEESYPYWLKGHDLLALQKDGEDRSNERAFDKFMIEVTSDGSALEYDEDDISEDLLKDIETFSDRRKSVIRHLIRLLEEIPYEEAA
ncbi:hypothetical protein ALT721_800039 [Alteromonas alvinellae]